MKKIKLTGQQVKFIINIISLSVFLISYFYIYTAYEDKAKAAYQEIDTTKKTMDQLQKQLSEEDNVRLQTQEVQNQAQTIIDSFPVNIAKEDNLMFIEKMQKALDITFSSVDIQDNTVLYKTILPIRSEDGTEIKTGEEAEDTSTSNTTATEPTAAPTQASVSSQDATLEGVEDGNVSDTTGQDVEGVAGDESNSSSDTKSTSEQQTMTGMQSTISLSFLTTYQGFKELVEYIRNYPDRTVINSISVSYDNATGDLTGSIVIKRFSLTGTGKVYEPPMIDDISIGTDNIFGSGSDRNKDTNSDQQESASQ